MTPAEIRALADRLDTCWDKDQPGSVMVHAAATELRSYADLLEELERELAFIASHF